MDTFMFNPSNIKSLYWRTMAIIARHFLVYYIFLNIILLGWIYFIFKVESLRNFFYMQKKNQLESSRQKCISYLSIFSLIGFLTIKFLVDRFINWFDITYSIIFIIIAFIQCFFFFCFLIFKNENENGNKKEKEEALKILYTINRIIFLILFILNFSLSFLNGYKKLWGVNEDVIHF